MPTSSLTGVEAQAVLDTYMMAYILGEHLGNMTLTEAKHLVMEMPEIFLAWNDTQIFVKSILKEMTDGKDVAKNADAGSLIDFATLVKVAETVGERFGRFQDAECKGLKDALVKVEEHGTGRVRLSDFYKPALDGQWQFQESIGYLRQLSTLDESNPSEPRVMVANYLISQANCIASSDYYSVCCIDECEDLLGHLEQSIAAPEAPPETIANLIATLPSSSVSAPRALGKILRERLNDIAEMHGGLVQLHGRLFAQWMHHAYPRECPFPHMSGTTVQEGAADWTDGSGGDSVATEEELQQWTVNSTSVETVEDVHSMMMWSLEEELIVERPQQPEVFGDGISFATASLRNVICLAAMVSIVYGTLKMGLKPARGSDVPEKFLV
jgi:hypothetical protein